ncbi:MAG: class I SAM-dependent methyltransferase, partial [Cyanobacteria bacterium P01_D01_bin.73]
VDFGAGVGRVSMGLNLSFNNSHVLSVDFSKGHLETLMENLKNPRLDLFHKVRPNNIQGLSYSTLDELRRHLSFLSPSLIVSTMVLQHNPPPLITFLTETLLNSLTKGGLAVLHIPVFGFHYSFDLNRYLSQSMESRMDMQMHAIPTDAIFEIAKNSDCQVVQFLPSHDCVDSFLSYDVVFQKS